MGLLQNFIDDKKGILLGKELEGITKIRNYAFTGMKGLAAVVFPDGDLYLGIYLFDNSSATNVILGNGYYDFASNVQAFAGNTAITHIDMNNISEESKITSLGFTATPWFKNLSAEQMVCVANNKILFTNTITKPSQGFNIPDTVTVLGGYSCQKYGDTADTNFTNFVIPDTIEIIQGSVFSGQKLTKITVGSSVRKIGFELTPSTSTTTLIFRQPAGMYIELPAAGSSSGMAYNKDSRSITIYTDNEYIKNYNWAADNATVTIYPLSQAPV